ncbi:choice-of-anchor A family protein, partial [Paenibacillus gorillae]|uniref:choice-of-anchor A family protein n=1 Tax=Paenibacillus gorillae TaxID=1243662 RepID=UPI00069371A4
MFKKQIKTAFMLTMSAIVIFGAGLHAIVSAAASPASSLLGTAGAYNIFVLGSVSLMNTDSEGPVAAGGAATFTNYSVNSKEKVIDNALVVGGSLVFNNGTVKGGNAKYGGSYSGNVTVTNGTSPKQGTPIDFNAEATYLKGVSAQLAALPANGTASNAYGTLTLVGTDNNLNVFEIDQNYGELVIQVPNGSTVIVNVKGISRSFGTAGTFMPDKSNTLSENTNPAAVRRLLFNFPEATDITIGSSGQRGTLLAPYASVKTTYSNIAGNIIAASLDGHVEAHYYPFDGTLAEPEATPTPTATPEATPTATPEATPTATPETTPTATPEATPTATPETTPTATPEATPTATPEVTPTATPEATPTATPEVTPTA